jgi:hypothetical protein
MSNEPTTPTPVKPGWQTTEFYQTLIVQALAFLTIFGVLSPADATGIGGTLASMVQNSVALIIAGGTVIHYITSRAKAKGAP